MIRTTRKLSLNTGVGFFAAAFHPRPIWACAACYGQSDSPMAAGMNWGIVSLLGMIVVVLGGLAAFFIFLARRSAALAKSNGGAAMVSKPVAISAISPHAADELHALPLAARGGFRRVSALAQQRKRCTHPQSEPCRLAARRGRS
jgi:hypothetical protein